MDNAIENYTKLGVDKIKDVDILEKKDFDIINNLSAELQRVFQIKQIWRTLNECRFAVLDDTNYPTPASKYWQCIREQDVFFTQLILTSCEYQIFTIICWELMYYSLTVCEYLVFTNMWWELM